MIAPINYTEQVVKANQPTVTRIYNMLEALFPKEAREESLKAKMFSEIIHRSIADVSGNINNESQRGGKSSTQPFRVTISENFNIVKKELHARGITGMDKVLDFFLGVVSGYSKGIVQTPHPTEMLGNKAIKAEEALVKFLEDRKDGAGEMFTGNFEVSNLGGMKQTELAGKIADLFYAIKPEEPLKIKDEMLRSVIFSERMFDAVPVIADRVLSQSGMKSQRLSKDQLLQLSHLVEPTTWSPGDQDSKPDMTIDQLQEGYHLNRERMLKHYAAKILDMVEKTGLSHYTSQKDQELFERSVTIALNCLNSAKIHDITELKDMNFQDYVEATLQKQKPKINKALMTTVVKRAVTSEPVAIYQNKQQLLDDLFALRDLDNQTAPKLHLIDKSNGSHDNSAITLIDGLIVQAANFGLTALRSQIRQNQDQHELAAARIMDHILPDHEGSFTEKMDIILRAPEHMQEVKHYIQQELKHIEADAAEKLGALSEDMLKQHPELKNLYYQNRAAAERMDQIQSSDSQHPSKEHQNNFNFYQILKSLEFATLHPDFIPQALIAECGGPDNQGKPRDVTAGTEDLLRAFFLKKIVEPSAEERKTAGLTSVEIVPLVEHPYQVMEKDGKIPYVEMMKQAFSNAHFVEDMKEITKEQYQHLIQHTTIENGEVVTKPLTGTDIIASVNPDFVMDQKHGTQSSALKPNPNEVHIAKLCMGAGSDIPKFGGVAASALVQNAVMRLREELAALPEPVFILDYLGCGGGIHRTQPVSSSFETVQGRSMRQTPDAIATKSVALLARNMFDRLVSLFPYTQKVHEEGASFPAIRTMKPEDRGLLAQLNMGNIANLPRAPKIWDDKTKELIQNASLAYTGFIQKDEYKALLSYSADMFCKLTSFGARPVNRLGGASNGAAVFPPEVNFKDLRAIGYGGALNASGSEASLYMGMGTLLDKNTDDLKKYYLAEPNFQDTINRSTYGLLMSDMNAAWKYVGLPKAPNELQVTKYLKPQTQDRLALARKALAEITIERNALIDKYTELHSKISGKIPTGPTKREKLLSVLPVALAHQINTSYENIELPRAALAATFQKMLQNNGVDMGQELNPTSGLPEPIADEINKITTAKITRDEVDGAGKKKFTDVYTNIIYPAMGAIFECTEHAPRAYTSPHWGHKQSVQESLGMAA